MLANGHEYDALEGNAIASTSAIPLDDADDSREILILYASQTGSAQDVAEYIAREAWRRHFDARVLSIADFDKAELLDAPPTIIVTSTTGQGHFPSAILPLWNFLIRSDLPEEMLSDFHYAIFGLGDSSYPKFNWPARKLSRRLEMLGARELIPKGEADDQHYLGIDGTLHPWLDELWSTLLQHFPLPPGKHILDPLARPPPRLRLSKGHANGHSHARYDSLSTPDGMQRATLHQNKRVTAESHFQDTRHIVLDLEHDNKYAPGDILDLRPENLPEDVDAFLSTMKWKDIADTAYRIESTSSLRPLPSHWPPVITLRELFTRYLDISSVPRRSFFEWLSYFTISELETEKLREFCTAEGQEDMYDYATRPRRTIHEVLQEFKSAQIPIEYVADIFPEIRPRQFSIASSSRKGPKQVELLVAIVKYRTKLQAPRKGVATTWLAQLKPGQQLSVGFTSGTMTFPDDVKEPLILIGPGTGIAPFRSFVQDRLTRTTDGGEILVFFGCRSAKSDYYFAEEWKEMEKNTGGRCSLILAASRDQEDKVYVQHKLAEEGQTVWRLIGKENGRVYISGASGQMPKSVQKALKKIFHEQGGMSEQKAEQYFEQMEKDGRYQEETWS